MIKFPVTYANFLDEDVKAEPYFNLSKRELTKMYLVGGDNWMEDFQKIDTIEDRERILELFEKLLLAGYGIRSEDGRKFTKSPELTEDFRSSGLFDEVFYQLMRDTDKAIAFFNGIVPAKALAEAKAEAERQEAEAAKLERPAPQDFQRKKVPLKDLQ